MTLASIQHRCRYNNFSRALYDASVRFENFQACRRIVTLSQEPWIVDKSGNLIRERAYSVLLMEDSLPYLLNHYANTVASSWSQVFRDFFPPRGVPFKYSSLSNISATDDKETLISQVMSELIHDIVQEEGSMPSSTVLVTRGPILSLVAQYYLESWPLAGLVMIDPLLLPPPHLTSTASQLLEHITKSQCPIDTTQVCYLALLQQLSDGRYSRKLQLEPGSVPMCVWSSFPSNKVPNEGFEYENNYSKYSQFTSLYCSLCSQTAKRHSDSNRQVTVHDMIEEFSQNPTEPSIGREMYSMLNTIYRFCEDNT